MKAKKIVALALVSALVLGLTACGGSDEEQDSSAKRDPKTKLVQVGEREPITQEQLDQYLALNALNQNIDISQVDESTKERLAAAMLDDMVALELMQQSYEDEGTKILPDDYDAQLKTFLDETKNSTEAAAFIKANDISEEGLTEFFTRPYYVNQFYGDLEKTMPAEYTDDQVTADHILLKTKSEAEESDQDARDKYNQEQKDKIDELYQQLVDGADFAELAKANSEDSSAVSGGALGTFGKGVMVKEFEDAAFSTTPGSFSKPIRSQFGYHIIRVDRHEEVTKPFEELDSTTQNRLMLEAYNKKIEELTNQYGVKWLDKDMEKTVKEVKESLS